MYKPQANSTINHNRSIIFVSKLINQQSDERDKRSNKLEGYIYTDIAGYMEYDPNTEALNAYKRNAQLTLKRFKDKEGNNGWLRLYGNGK